MGNVRDITSELEEKRHADLVKALREKAGPSPHPNSVGALMREAADYIQVRPPWLGNAEHRWIAELVNEVARLKRVLHALRVEVDGIHALRVEIDRISENESRESKEGGE